MQWIQSRRLCVRIALGGYVANREILVSFTPSLSLPPSHNKSFFTFKTNVVEKISLHKSIFTHTRMANQNSLFRSRETNGRLVGPVFPDSVENLYYKVQMSGVMFAPFARANQGLLWRVGKGVNTARACCCLIVAWSCGVLGCFAIYYCCPNDCQSFTTYVPPIIILHSYNSTDVHHHPLYHSTKPDIDMMKRWRLSGRMPYFNGLSSLYYKLATLACNTLPSSLPHLPVRIKGLPYWRCLVLFLHSFPFFNQPLSSSTPRPLTSDIDPRPRHDGFGHDFSNHTREELLTKQELLHYVFIMRCFPATNGFKIYALKNGFLGLGLKQRHARELQPRRSEREREKERESLTRSEILARLFPGSPGRVKNQIFQNKHLICRVKG
eukprot:sb/3465658/